MDLYQRIEALCQQKNISVTTMCRECGVSRGSLGDIKSGRKKSLSLQALCKIADYFAVSVDSLAGQKPTAPNAVILDTRRIHMIPVFESVSAGFGTLAIDAVTDYMPLYFTEESEAQDTILVRVQGDSMYPKIEHGDLIQVKKQTSVDSGSIAVVLLDGEEALVKRVLYTDTRIELHSINPMYAPLRFEGKEVTRLQVLGEVRRIIKEV